MNRLILFLLITLCPAVTFAGEEAPDEWVIFRFVEGRNMFYSPYGGNEYQLDDLYALIDKYRTEIDSGEMPVYVDGYCTSLAGERTNRYIAFIRANRVKSEMIIKKGLVEDNFRTKNYTTVYTDPVGNIYKDIVIVSFQIPVVNGPEEDLRPVPEERTQQEPEPPVVVVDPLPQPVPVVEPPIKKRTFPDIDLRTNLLYDAFLTPTLGLEWHVNAHIGVKLDGSYAYWGSKQGRVQKIWLVNPEIRWYLPEAKQWYMGVGGTLGAFNLYKGIAGILSDHTGYQGDLYGGGMTVGCQLPLNSCLRMDFNVGLGYTRIVYDTFTVVDGYRLYKEKELMKNLWGPTQAGVSLVWKPGNKN